MVSQKELKRMGRDLANMFRRFVPNHKLYYMDEDAEIRIDKGLDRLCDIQPFGPGYLWSFGDKT